MNTSAKILLTAIILFSHLLWGGTGLEILAQPVFQKMLNTNRDGGDVGADIKQTADSGFIMGINNGFAYRGTEIVSVVSLAKTDASAAVQWVKSYRALPYISCAEVQQTIDGGYIMVGLMKESGGNDQIDGFVFKTDAMGAIQWSKRLGRSNFQDDLTSVQQTSDSGYILLGRTAGFGSGGINTWDWDRDEGATDVWLIKLKSSGAVEWTKTYGNTNINEWGHTVRQTTDGGFAISANLSDSVGTPAPAPGFNGGGGYNGLFLKTDNNGNLEWSKLYSASDGVNERPLSFLNSFQQTSDKGFIVTGQAAEKESGTDIHGAWLLKLDSAGNTQWNNVYDAAATGTTVFQLPDGGYVVETGFGLSAKNNSTSGSGSVLFRTHTLGDISWAKEYGGSSNSGIIDNLPAMTLLKEGGYALFGYTYAGMNNNGNISGNFTDLFFVKADTSECGTCQHTILPRVYNPLLAVTTVTLSVSSGISVSATGLDEVDYSWQDTIGCFTSPVSADFYTQGVCAGDSTRFNSGSVGAALFNWNFGDTASGTADTSTLSTLPKHLFTAAGTYTVTLIATDGCGSPSDTITKTVTIGSGNFLSASPDVSICRGASTLLTASGATSQNPGLAHYWQPAYLYGDSISVSPDSTTIYRVAGDNGYCTDIDSVTVTVVLSMASINGEDTICNGNSTTLTASGGAPYLWSTGVRDSSINVSPLVDSLYWVIASSGFCSDTARVKIKTLSNPLPNAGADVTVNYGSGMALFVTGTGSYLWYPPEGLSCTDCSSPMANPESSTIYYVKLTDSFGCTARDSVRLFVDLPCGEVFVPNAFSPNNDNQNDILYARVRCEQSIEFKIFDRWGNKVFESTQETEGWDGTYKNRPMNSGVFVYFLDATLENGELIRKKGNIFLMR